MTRIKERKMSNIEKIKLIKKYAKIRFKRFWREWGITKEEFYILLTYTFMLILLFELYLIGCLF